MAITRRNKDIDIKTLLNRYSTLMEQSERNLNKMGIDDPEKPTIDGVPFTIDMVPENLANIPADELIKFHNLALNLKNYEENLFLKKESEFKTKKKLLSLISKKISASGSLPESDPLYLEHYLDLLRVENELAPIQSKLNLTKNKVSMISRSYELRRENEDHTNRRQNFNNSNGNKLVKRRPM